jgi:hypothetical protein
MDEIIEQELQCKEMNLRSKKLNLTQNLNQTGFVTVVDGVIVEENGESVQKKSNEKNDDDSDDESDDESEESILSIASKDSEGGNDHHVKRKKRTIENEAIFMRKTPDQEFTDEELKPLYKDGALPQISTLLTNKCAQKNELKGNDEILVTYKESMEQVIQQ